MSWSPEAQQDLEPDKHWALLLGSGQVGALAWLQGCSEEGSGPGDGVGTVLLAYQSLQCTGCPAPQSPH